MFRLAVRHGTRPSDRGAHRIEIKDHIRQPRPVNLVSVGRRGGSVFDPTDQEVLSDQFELVSVGAGWLPLMRRRDHATRKERRSGSPRICPGSGGRVPG